jgi:hypothetical protein
MCVLDSLANTYINQTYTPTWDKSTYIFTENYKSVIKDCVTKQGNSITQATQQIGQKY